jgi:cytochrome oxidase Cu insertion factor (SCO1/SenC/PrrC family)
VGLCVTAAGATTVVPAARADGDPASDYLVARQVFTSSQQAVNPQAQRALVATVGAANRAGFTIRVAVISSDYDLGSITALWRKPALDARFLGLELPPAYRGRLLVVMPAGFGFNWPAQRTGSQQQVLATIAIGSGQAELLTAAQTAVRRLAAADGVSFGSTTATAVGATRGRRSGGGSVAAIAAAVVGVLVLAGLGFVLVRRRQRGTSRSNPRRPASTALPRRHRLGIAVPGFAALCAVAVAAPILVLRSVRDHPDPSIVQGGSVITPPARTWPADRRRAPNFFLHDQAGRAVSLGAYRGRPVIVTFVDPLCRNLCPLEAKVLNDAVGRMPARARPPILAVSVDVYGGANRRVNLLRDVHQWSLVPQWRWAVGSPAQLTAVWQRYEIGVKVTTKTIAETTIHYVTHTEAAFIVDATGHERALFLWPFYPQDVERALRQFT